MSRKHNIPVATQVVPTSSTLPSATARPSNRRAPGILWIRLVKMHIEITFRITPITPTNRYRHTRKNNMDSSMVKDGSPHWNMTAPGNYWASTLSSCCCRLKRQKSVLFFFSFFFWGGGGLLDSLALPWHCQLIMIMAALQGQVGVQITERDTEKTLHPPMDSDNLIDVRI